jgi:succinyl-diaminopimelate desuccinylase
MANVTDKRVSDAVAVRRDDLVALTQDLIRIPTLNPPGRNYREICSYLAERLGKAGFAVEMRTLQQPP